MGLQLTIIGVVIGLAGALGLNRLIASVLFGVQPTDPTTLAVVIMTTTSVAAAACWPPAWRASRYWNSRGVYAYTSDQIFGMKKGVSRCAFLRVAELAVA